MKICWDLIMILIILSQFYLNILDFCFQYNNSGDDGLLYWNFYEFWVKILLVFVFFDIVLKINSGYFVNGMQVMDRKTIIVYYLESEFIFDVVAFSGLLMDIILVNVTEYHSIIKMLFFFKYPILKNLIRKIEEIINFDEKIIAIISLLKLFSKMLFLSHIIACLWFCLPFWNPGNNWMISKNIIDTSLWGKYIISLYWAFVTITTIGYGDIVPQNQNEYLFTMGVIIIGSIFFGYSLTSIGIIFHDLDKDELQKKYL